MLHGYGLSAPRGTDEQMLVLDTALARRWDGAYVGSEPDRGVSVSRR